MESGLNIGGEPAREYGKKIFGEGRGMAIIFEYGKGEVTTHLVVHGINDIELIEILAILDITICRNMEQFINTIFERLKILRETEK